MRGHATLAVAPQWSWSAWSLDARKWSSILGKRTTHSQPLRLSRLRNGFSRASFPGNYCLTPPGLTRALSVDPLAVRINQFNYLAVLQSAQVVRQLAPDMTAIARMDRPGVIVTAPGDDGIYHFVSRYLLPRPKAFRKTTSSYWRRPLHACSVLGAAARRRLSFEPCRHPGAAER